MKQVVQNFRDGRLTLADVPAPAAPGPQGVLIANRFSLISAGTERATIEIARKSLLAKAQARPDLVRKVIDSVRREGLVDAMKTVAGRLDRSAPLGYSCAGVVLGVGADVQGLAVGDRVACAGQDHASHAEFVVVPQNLCVPVPAAVDLADAAYVALGAIALQAIRQTEPRLGETVVVIGLGLVGILIAQLLRANGCTVIGSEVDASRVALARTLGIDSAIAPGDLGAEVARRTGGHGADAAIVAASTTGNEPIAAAAASCRRKGRVVVVGAVGMTLPREPFYRNELELKLSTSYGPGRYDPRYEESGVDYPYGYVRWTERRNMAAFLDLVAQGRVDAHALTSHRFAVADAGRAYELIATRREHMGVVLCYDPSTPKPETRLALRPPREQRRMEIGVIGAGAHVRDKLLPRLRARSDASVRAVCCRTGVSAKTVAARVGAEYCTTNLIDVLDDPRIDAVVIGTRHDLHASVAIDALARGKDVLIEKPLCLDAAELTAIEAAHDDAARVSGAVLCVGFNRRHSAHVRRVREFFAACGAPLTMVYRVNAGALPRDHWLFDPKVGGGRIVGEICHFVDTVRHIANAPIVRVHAIRTRREGDNGVVASLEFGDGSIATVIYVVDGDRGIAKERLEIAGAGRTALIDDYRVTDLHRDGRRRRFRGRRQDKGFDGQLEHFATLRADPAAADTEFRASVATTRATFALLDSLASGMPTALG